MAVGHDIRVCTLISVVRPNNDDTLQRQYQERSCVIIDTSTAQNPGYHVVSVVPRTLIHVPRALTQATIW